MTDTELAYTLSAIVVLFTLVELWHLRNRKPKHRLEYFRNLCASLHYINDVAVNIEQMILMIEDIENTPRRFRKPISITVPDSLTNQINTGKFTIRNVKDSEIFIKVIDSECCELCTRLLEMIEEALRTGTIQAYDTSTEIPELEAGEESEIDVYDHMEGKYTI